MAWKGEGQLDFTAIFPRRRSDEGDPVGPAQNLPGVETFENESDADKDERGEEEPGQELRQASSYAVHVEVAVHEFRGQTIEQGGIGGGIAGTEVIDRLDDAHAQEVAPDAIDVALGEVGVVLGRDPFGEVFAAAVRGLGT